MFLMTGEMQTLHPKNTPILFFNKGKPWEKHRQLSALGSQSSIGFPSGSSKRANDR